MQITVTVSDEQLEKFKQTFKECIDREPTENEVLEFFTADIANVYSDTFEDNLEDAISESFGDDE